LKTSHRLPQKGRLGGLVRLAVPLLLMASVLAFPPILGADPPAQPAMHPMARDMLDRMLAAGRAAPDPARRRAIFADAAEGIPRAFYGAILGAIPAPEPGTPEFDAAQAVFSRWAWQTPDFAATWAASSPPGPFRRIALVEAAGSWAARKPADAAQWARGLLPADRDWVFAKADQFMNGASPESAAAWQRARAL
jgi:hypothetical protein